MEKPQIGHSIPLTIDRLSYGQGAGVGRFQGFVLFVDDTAPGDQILAEVVEIKKNYGIAKLIEVLTPGPERRHPPCPFVECGGCQWQHIHYKEQLKQKQNILEHLMNPLCSKEKIKKIIASPQTLGYRNRIQVHSKNNLWGFKKKQSHDTIYTNQCKIAHPLINQKADDLLKKMPPGRYQLSLLKNNNVELQKKREGNIDLFSQVNTEVNQLIQEVIGNYLTWDSIDTLIDAYCGSGNFGFYMHKQKPSLKVIGLEMSSSSLNLAKKKSSQSESPKAFSWILGPCEKTFPKELKKLKSKKNTVLILDPPKSGCHPKFIKTLKQSQIPTLMYLSCDPNSLKRDLKHLLDNYNIDWIQGFDMFPQTYHLETLVLLRLKP